MKTIHVVLNEFAPDYRVLKETTALANAGWEVEAYALGRRGLAEREVIDGVLVRRFVLGTRGLPKSKLFLPLKFAECIVRMTVNGVRARPDVVHAHDLSGLVVGYLIAVFSTAKMVYDSHELWSDSNHRNEYPAIVGRGMVALERLLAPAAARTITVSGGIAEKMSEILRIPIPALVRNVPERAPASVAPSPLRETLGIPSSAVVFLHVGAILRNRGVDTLLSAFEGLNRPDTHLVFLGIDEFPEWLALPKSSEVLSRIHIHDRVPPREVVPLARGADIGIVATSGVSASHRYCLPNKFFETIQAGLPVIATDLPEMSRIIAQYGIGATFPDGSVAGLKNVMSALVVNSDARERMKGAAESAAGTLCWENESAVLLDVYAALANTETAIVSRPDAA